MSIPSSTADGDLAGHGPASSRGSRQTIATRPRPGFSAVSATSTATLPPPTTTTSGPTLGRRHCAPRAGSRRRRHERQVAPVNGSRRDNCSAQRQETGVEVLRPSARRRELIAAVRCGWPRPDAPHGGDLRVQHLGRQAVGGDAVAHHAAGPGAGLEHLDAWPARARYQAADSPAGPEPTTATRSAAGRGRGRRRGRWPACSAATAFIGRMNSGAPLPPRRQARSHGAGQTRPQEWGRGLSPAITASAASGWPWPRWATKLGMSMPAGQAAWQAKHGAG